MNDQKIESAKKVYTVQEIAHILNISQRSVYNLCESEKYFKVIRIGRSIRILKESFDKWLYKNTGEE